MSVVLSILYALVGWAVLVVWYYFEYDTDEPFDFPSFWNKYDKYIILGFVGAIGLGILSDFLWDYMFMKLLNTDIPYQNRFAIFVGLSVVPIIKILQSKIK